MTVSFDLSQEPRTRFLEALPQAARPEVQLDLLRQHFILTAQYPKISREKAQNSRARWERTRAIVQQCVDDVDPLGAAGMESRLMDAPPRRLGRVGQYVNRLLVNFHLQLRAL